MEGGRKGHALLCAPVSISGGPPCACTESLTTSCQFAIACSPSVSEDCFNKTRLVSLTEQPSGSCYQRTEIRAMQWYEITRRQVDDQMSGGGGEWGSLVCFSVLQAGQCMRLQYLGRLVHR